MFYTTNKKMEEDEKETQLLHLLAVVSVFSVVGFVLHLLKADGLITSIVLISVVLVSIATIWNVKSK